MPAVGNGRASGTLFHHNYHFPLRVAFFQIEICVGRAIGVIDDRFHKAPSRGINLD